MYTITTNSLLHHSKHHHRMSSTAKLKIGHHADSERNGFVSKGVCSWHRGVGNTLRVAIVRRNSSYVKWICNAIRESDIFYYGCKLNYWPPVKCECLFAGLCMILFSSLFLLNCVSIFIIQSFKWLWMNLYTWFDCTNTALHSVAILQSNYTTDGYLLLDITKPLCKILSRIITSISKCWNYLCIIVTQWSP